MSGCNGLSAARFRSGTRGGGAVRCDHFSNLPSTPSRARGRSAWQMGPTRQPDEQGEHLSKSAGGGHLRRNRCRAGAAGADGRLLAVEQLTDRVSERAVDLPSGCDLPLPGETMASWMAFRSWSVCGEIGGVGAIFLALAASRAASPAAPATRQIIGLPQSGRGTGLSEPPLDRRDRGRVGETAAGQAAGLLESTTACVERSRPRRLRPAATWRAAC